MNQLLACCQLLRGTCDLEKLDLVPQLPFMADIILFSLGAALITSAPPPAASAAPPPKPPEDVLVCGQEIRFPNVALVDCKNMYKEYRK